MTLATDLRSGSSSLVALAARDLAAFWAQIAVYEAAAYAGDAGAAATLREALMDVLPSLAGSYQDAAISLAADLYDLERLRLDISGDYRAPGIVIPDGGAALAGWALKEAVTSEGLRGLVAGGLTKRIMQAANRTVMGAATGDRAATGWQRVARTGGCDFCRMIAGRGAVYTRESADFAAHGDCLCVATVAWDGREIPVKPYRVSPRGTAADTSAVREWIATHDIP